MIDSRKPIQVWHWDYKTSELLEETGFAYPDERDANNYLIPARATTDEPPKPKKGYKVLRDLEKNKWVCVKNSK